MLIKWIHEEFDLLKVTPPWYSPIRCALSKRGLNLRSSTIICNSDHHNKVDQFSQEAALLLEKTSQYYDMLDSVQGEQLEKEVLDFVNLMPAYNKPPNNLELEEFTKLVEKRLGVDPKLDFDDGVWFKIFCTEHRLQLMLVQTNQQQFIEHHHEERYQQQQNNNNQYNQHEVLKISSDDEAGVQASYSDKRSNHQESNNQHDQHEIIEISSDEEADKEASCRIKRSNQQRKKKEEEETRRGRRKLVAIIKSTLQSINSPQTEEEIQLVSTGVKVLLKRSSKLVQEDLSN